MMKTITAKLAPYDAERDAIAKQIAELQEKYDAMNAKRATILHEALATLSDDECQYIEDCVFRLFKIYNSEDTTLSRVSRRKFRILNSSWDDGMISFVVSVEGVGEYNISEHPAVFDDIEKYISLRQDATKTNKARTQIRVKNDLANQKVADFLESLKPIG